MSAREEVKVGGGMEVGGRGGREGEGGEGREGREERVRVGERDEGGSQPKALQKLEFAMPD